MNAVLRSLFCFAVFAILSALPLWAVPAGTAFTYQGRLNDNGAAAAGLYDFTVQVHSAATGGSALAEASLPGVLVADGVFTIQLDFGAAVFDGSARWLEITVLRQGEAGPASVLSPRQETAPAPYALMAMKVPAGSITGANLAAGAVGGSQIAPGSIGPDKLAHGAAAGNLAASGQSGVASGGVVLSPSPAAPDLIGAGYFQVGKTDLIPEKWEHLADAPDATPIVSANAKSVWTGLLLLAWGGGTNTGGRYNPVSNAWTPMSTVNAPAARTGHCVVWTGSEMIVWGGSDGTNNLITGGRYNPSTNTWTAMSVVNAPPARADAPAVWTGSEMIVWGGGNDLMLSTGGRYNPATNTWQSMSAAGSPVARYGHSMVWTGSRVIVFGGAITGEFQHQFVTMPTGSGASYNPSGNTWTAIAGTESGIGHAAVWTGSAMLVTGGYRDWSDYPTNIPARLALRYSPASNTWSPISGDFTETERSGHSAVWTGTEMIIWGGKALTGVGLFGGVYTESMTTTGARYNPVTDAWTPLDWFGAPASRFGHSAVWTGSQMVITGGGQPVNGRYDSASDSWSVLPGSTERAPRTQGTMVWTGSEALIWGGLDDTGLTIQSGLRFRPETGVWSAISSQGAPAARRGHAAVWTGSRMIVWGGRNDAATFNDGALYDPVTDTWTPVTSYRAPSRREGHRAVWTGSGMLVWGGNYGASLQQSGGLYDPETNQWQTVNTAGAPAGRTGFALVWTGTEAVLWGGELRGTPLTTGGRYSPALNTWQPMSLTGVPPGRTDPAGVWTGEEIIFYGGGNAADGYPDVHGRYDPAEDAWKTLPPPSGPRAGHCAVWNGSRLIVWSGHSGSGLINSGSTYSPESDTWTGVNSSLPNTPSARSGALSVWAGNAMLVWGGRNSQSFLTKDMYSYTPAASFYLYQRP